MKKISNFLLHLPLLALSVDLWINVARLIIDFARQGSKQTAPLSKDIPVALEDIQLVQIFGNAAMALIITLAVIGFIGFSNKIRNKEYISLNGFIVCSLLVIFAYTFPGFWTATTAFAHLFTHGTFPLSLSNPWNALIALFLPYAFLLFIIKIISYLIQRRQYSFE